MALWQQTIRVLFVAIAVAALTGCVKLKQTLTVMPDGAGKVQLRFGLSKQMIDLAKESGEDPFKEVRPEKLMDTARGVAAFTEPVTQKQGDYTYLTYAAYFRDINKLKLEPFGEGMPCGFKYKRAGNTATLTVTNGTVLSMLAEYEPTPREEREDIRQAMAGLAFNETYILPGKYKAIDGVAQDGNTATIELTVENLLDETGPVKALKGKNSLTLEVTEITVDDDARAAFKKEIDDAVTAWKAKR